MYAVIQSPYRQAEPMTSINSYSVIGIDPGSGKGLQCFSDDGWTTVSPNEAKHWVHEKVKHGGPLLVTWDAPISFNAQYGLTFRPIERSNSPIQKWLTEQQQSNCLAPNAVFVGGFSGLSHWVISCECLGMPFGDKPEGLTIAKSHRDLENSQKTKFVIEVHPAVSLAVWWVATCGPGPLPKYKGALKAEEKQKARSKIWDHLKGKGLVANLRTPKNDDELDAWVAWKMGTDFLSEKAYWIGDPIAGGFVLPVEAERDFNLSTQMAEHINNS